MGKRKDRRTYDREVHLGVRRIQIRLFQPGTKRLFRDPGKGHVVDQSDARRVGREGGVVWVSFCRLRVGGGV
jgi:hypothetical protein